MKRRRALAPPVRPGKTDHLACDNTDGVVERMLRQAHEGMKQAMTQEPRSSVTSERRTPSSTVLKRSKSAAIGPEGGNDKKRRKTESRRDDWDVPHSSSPSKPASSKASRSRRGEEAMVIITEPGSTIMDSTSSNERRARELQSQSAAPPGEVLDGVNDTGDCTALEHSQASQTSRKTSRNQTPKIGRAHV